MKNRKWLRDQSLIDLLMKISTRICPIVAITGQEGLERECLLEVNQLKSDRTLCCQCLCEWLNEEQKEKNN